MTSEHQVKPKSDPLAWFSSVQNGLDLTTLGLRTQIKLDKAILPPIYRLRAENSWRKISVVNVVNSVHFIHNCKDNECIGNSHDLKNDMYIQNMYYFKAV
jgi:hypothetical protein